MIPNGNTLALQKSVTHPRIRLIHMLINHFALLGIEVFGICLRELFEGVENCHADSGAGLLSFAPIKDKAFGFEGVE